MELNEAKEAMQAAVERRRELLLNLSHQIHGNPELSFDEHHAHDLLVSALRQDGLEVEARAFGLPTAFRATAGSTGPTIAVFCEYDALPGMGHACGHNIIAAAGLGAALAAATLAESLGGRIVVFGSPAEESGGGKVFMTDAGALNGVDAAMMIHPADVDLRSMTAIAIKNLVCEYHGESAHAAAAPWDGRNALDAAVLGYLNVAAIRQHIRPDERVHGIFRSGGDKPNIVPQFASTEWAIRAPKLSSVDALAERVQAALRASATATGCEASFTWIEPAYADLQSSPILEELFTNNAAALGRVLGSSGIDGEVIGSTDMGNVSHVVPTIHPLLAVAPRGTGIHTDGFTEHAAAPSGDAAVIDGAKAMAMTIADLWLQPEVLAQCRNEFAQRS